MSYRENDEVPESNQRSYMVMRAFPLEVGGLAENIEAHQWLNAMRKDGWHLVSASTGTGEIPIPGANQMPGGRTRMPSNIITFQDQW